MSEFQSEFSLQYKPRYKDTKVLQYSRDSHDLICIRRNSLGWYSRWRPHGKNKAMVTVPPGNGSELRCSLIHAKLLSTLMATKIQKWATEKRVDGTSMNLAMVSSRRNFSGSTDMLPLQKSRSEELKKRRRYESLVICLMTKNSDIGFMGTWLKY